MYGRTAAPRTSRHRLDSLRAALPEGDRERLNSSVIALDAERESWDREAERAACLAYELHVALTCATETSAAAWADVREEDGR